MYLLIYRDMYSSVNTCKCNVLLSWIGSIRQVMTVYISCALEKNFLPETCFLWKWMFIVHNCFHVWRYMHLYIAISPIVFLFILQILQIVFMPLFYLINKYESVFWRFDVYKITYSYMNSWLIKNIYIAAFKTNTLQLNTENKIAFLSLFINCA